MTDFTIFDQTFNLDATSDVSVDFSASQGYTGFTGNSPWQVRIVVDGTNNAVRGGAGFGSDVVSCMGACGSLAPGNHNVKVIWYGDSYIKLQGSTLRILVTKR